MFAWTITIIIVSVACEKLITLLLHIVSNSLGGSSHEKTIIINSLTVQYDDNKVIDDFSYTIEPGRCYAVMGASGIGKTSLINAIMGLIPYTGTISCDEDFKISAVFQEDRLCEGMSASRNIKIVCDSKEQISRIPGLMSDFGLSDCVSRKVRNLSGGMKRRVAIIRALLSSHDLLIMDEPFKGLDETTSACRDAFSP